MARNVEVHIDRQALRRVLNSPAVRAMTVAAAHRVAEKAGTGGDVKLFQTDRPHAVVSIPAWLQAREGMLSRAAAQAGLRVKPNR